MKKILVNTALATSLLFGSSVVSVFPNVDFATAAAADKKERRRTPALGARVYSQLARAQELADAGNVAEGLEVLDSVKAKSSSLNSYEKAMMYNFYGFIYYNAERVPEAIEAFEQVVAQEPIPESLEKSTLYSLAQLAMANSLYDKTLTYLGRWEAVHEGDVPVKNHVLKAQATYQDKQYEAALKHIKNAMKQAKKDDLQADESWYVLQRAIYFELEKPVQVTRVLEDMVRLFNKAEYWVQLAGMYGELGEEQKQLAVMEAAYQQGYVTKRSDLRNLAQIYYFNGMPYKAAKVLDKAMKDNIVESSVKNLTFLAQSWLGAKEYNNAISVYQELAKKTDNGDADQQIAEIYLQQGNFAKTIVAAEKADKRGKLSNPGNLYLALGMASFNLNKFDKALTAFEQAKEIKSSNRMAVQWLKFVEREQKNAEQLAKAN